MTDQWMPTSDQVRISYGAGVNDGCDFHPSSPLRETDPEFDRWLAALKAEVAANALRKAAQILEDAITEGGDGPVMVAEVIHHVRLRADRIESDAANPEPSTGVGSSEGSDRG